jgi:proline racemase
MRSVRTVSVVDSHTEGMPTRVVTGGVPVLPGATMLERRAAFEAEHDHLRTWLMYEPHGHGAMSGAILQPPLHPDADWAVLFIEVSGCLAMCGHGTIGVATTLVETGMVEVTEPTTSITLETPAGLVRAEVAVESGRARAVTIRNVPSFLALRDARVEVGGDVGTVTLDVAFGGNFYALLPAADVGLRVDPAHHDDLIRTGLQVIAAAEEQLAPAHPLDPAIRGIEHVVLTAAAADVPPAVDGRAATAIHPGWIDRSPCGTGTSARLATLHARGQLALQTDYVHASLLGSTFTGRLVEETTVGPFPAVVPTITGRAWITAMGQHLLDPDDPYPHGFLLGSGAAPGPAIAPAPSTGQAEP